jgi:dihydroorotate dehydrogenase
MKPWLWLPPTWSHALAPAALPLAAFFAPRTPVRWKSLRWKGLEFNNPLGLAGGVDKEGTQLIYWQNLGAGFLEVGTITPRPQGPNPGVIMDRDTKTLSVWNKMGFPNPGAEVVQAQLEKIRPQLKVPLFINIGKNRDTDNKDAIKDYIAAFNILKSCSDVFVINISSPNTKGLRDLQSREHLRDFLAGIRQVAFDKKLLLKLSPDMPMDQLKESLDLGVSEKMDGFILTNTTLQRPESLPFPASEGGVSGNPLKQLSRQALSAAIQHLGNIKQDHLIVSVGGILDSDEIAWRLENGADLVQVYAALVYHGPFFFQKVAKHPWH